MLMSATTRPRYRHSSHSWSRQCGYRRR